MAKKIYYRYNAETDNFERVYPTLRGRLASMGKLLLAALFLAGIIFIIIFYCFELPTEENLKAENQRLKSQYSVLNKRLDNTLQVLDNIKERDNNFYRVLMQLEPVTGVSNMPGHNDEGNFREIKTMSDEQLIDRFDRKINFLENRIYSQIKSFNELKQSMGEQQDRLAHIPSIIPIPLTDYTMSSGYGYRRDPIYGTSKFHEGLDFAANSGTNVFATADGVVEEADRRTSYGNCIDINHGYNYMSRYAHLSEILVKKGEQVKRGQLIGKVGSTGKSTGPHLHYEVRFKGEAQNPVNYYFMDLTPEEYAAMIQESENAGHVMD